MKLKILRKKIRRLEARLIQGPKKLAKLKRKLEAITAADARKARRKAAARAVDRQGPQPSMPKLNKKLETKPPVKPVREKRPSAAKTVKRKLNLSPERRAQLAAAMKARWVAKRAVAEANTQDPAAGRDYFPRGQISPSP